MTHFDDIIEGLSEREPSEIGGSVAANRFAYQNDWVVCRMVELYESGQDFTILCEWHDDVLILRHENDKECVSVVQVKTEKEKNCWTINKISKCKKTKNGNLPSIIEKILKNMRMVGEIDSVDETDGHFVSNRPFSDAPDDPELSGCLPTCRFRFADLSADVLEKIEGKMLDNELDLNKDSVDLHFHESELSVRNHSDIAKGKLVDFIEGRYPHSSGRIKPAYTAIYSEVNKRATCEMKSFDRDKLKEHKAITRSDFENMIEEISKERCRDSIDPVISWLQAEGVKFGSTISLREGLGIYVAKKLGNYEPFLKDVAQVAKEVLSEMDGESMLKDVIEGKAEVIKRFKQEYIGISNDVLLAGVVMEVYNGQST